MAVTHAEAVARVNRILSSYRQAADSGHPLLRGRSGAGKMYEAWVLCEVLERLARDERYTITLRGGTSAALKSSPGPINRDFPYFEAVGHRRPTLEVWTDVEFLTLSHDARGAPRSPARSDYHELDIVVVEANDVSRYPTHRQIRVGVECKNTGYSKNLLREILGVRRELSLLQPPCATGFVVWPRREVPADPPSCLMVYGTDPTIRLLRPPDDIFGIDFVYYPPP